MFTKPFQQLSKHDANIAGGKGASLGEMITSGIPVPDGFVVLSTTFDKFLEITDISIEIEAILNKVNHNEVHTVENASKQIQSLILNAKMPKDIAKEIKTEFSKLNCKYVAVRSSATAEDSASAAWAGQLDSFLNTTEETLLENVQRCFASLFTPRAIFYRFEKELHNQIISVAVVVQRMVNSKVSGIAFSVHPVTEDRNQIIIEAGFGLGEAIVSGQITPDSYVVTKDDLSILDKNVYTQERGIFRDDKKGGNEWRNIPKATAKEQCLSDKQIIELSSLIIKIENHYNFPCDIEWAMEDDIFYIVQSRPITTLKINIAKDSDSSLNIIDYLSSIKWHYIHKRYRTPFYFYLLWEGASKHHNNFFDFPYEIKRILNLDNDLMFAKEDWSELKKIAEAKIAEDEDILLKTIKNGYEIDKNIKLFASKINNNTFNKSTNKELLVFFQKYLDLSLRAASHMVFPLLLENFLESKIKSSLSMFFKNSEISKAEQLFTTSIKSSSVQEEELCLLKLCINKKNNKLLQKDILKHVNKYKWLKNVSMNNEYYTKEEVLSRINENLLDNPEEKIKKIIDSKKIFLKDLNSFKRRIKDKKIIKYIETLQEAIFFRSWRTEKMYENISLFGGLMEEVSVRIGIYDFNDFFFLCPNEIIELLIKDEKANMDIIESRKKRVVMYANGVETNIFSGDFVFEAKNKIKFIDEDLNKKDFFSGQKAYPGKVIGEVCVIRDGKDFDNFIDGKILVCHSTTPDYLQIIKRSSAIVTEKSDVLSHASIVSREFKKPCIIGTKIATQVLEDGNEVEVDADNGVVRILNKKSDDKLKLYNEFIKSLEGHEMFTFSGPYSNLAIAGTAWSNNKYLKKYFTESKTFNVLSLIKGKETLGSINNHFYRQYAVEYLKKAVDNKVSLEEIEHNYNFLDKRIDNFYKKEIANPVQTVKEAYDLIVNLIMATVYIELFDRNVVEEVLNKKINDSIWNKVANPDFEHFEERWSRLIKKSKSHQEVDFVFMDYYFLPSEKELEKRWKQEKKKNIKEKNNKGFLMNDEPWMRFTQFAIKLRDIRKDPIAKLQTLICKSARMLYPGVDDSLLAHISCLEIIDNKLPDVQELIKRRDNGYVLLVRGNDTYEYDYDSYHEIKKLINKVDDDIAVIQGTPASPGVYRGVVKIILDPNNSKNFKKGDILVTGMTRPDFVPLMKRAGAIVTAEGGVTCHAAIVSRELGVPCVIGTKIAVKVLKDGDEVEVDADNGVVRILKKADEISTDTREASNINFLNKKELLNFLTNNEFDVQSAKASFFMCDLVFSIYARFIKTNIGDFPVLSYLDSNNQFREIISKNDILKIGEYLYSRFEKGGIAEIKKMIRNQIEIEEILDSFKNQKGIDIKVYSDFINKFKKWWEYALLLEDKGQFSYQKIEELLLERLGEEKTKKIMGDIFCSSSISVFSEERIHFYNICLRVFKNSEIKEKILKNKPRDLENSLLKKWYHEYNEKYFYFKTDFYERKEITFNDFIKDLKNEIISGDASAISNKIKAIKKEFVIMKNKMKLARLELSKEELEVSDYINQLINWSDRRKIGMMKTLYYLLGFLKEISIEKKIEYGELILCSSDEVFRLLETGSLPKSKIRGDLFGCYYGDDSKFFFGDEALEVFSLVNFGTKNIVGQVASRGGGGVFRGVVRVINDPFRQKFNKDDILVTTMTRIDFVPIMGIAKAIITDEGGVTSHAAIVSRELGKPCIIGTKIATQVLQDGDEVDLDADNGVVKVLKRK